MDTATTKNSERPRFIFIFLNFNKKLLKVTLKNFKKWKEKKIKFIKHHDLHTYTAIGSSSFNKGVYFNIDGGGDEGDTRNFTWENLME